MEEVYLREHGENKFGCQKVVILTMKFLNEWMDTDYNYSVS